MDTMGFMFFLFLKAYTYYKLCLNWFVEACF